MSDRLRRFPSPLRMSRLYLPCVGVCLLARIALVTLTDGRSVYTRWSTATDAGVYDRFGWNLATRGILGVEDRPSAFALPAYPLLLAGTYRIAGHTPGAIRWVQVGLGVLTVICLGRLARCLGGERSELFTVAAGSLYPFFLYFILEIMTETLFLFALSGMLLAAARLGHSGRVWDGILHGAFATVAVLTRPAGLALLPGALVLARPWAREHRGSRVAGLLLGFLLLGLAWGGWIGRNRAVFGERVFLDTHGGFALYVGQLYSRGLTSEEVARKVGYGHTDIEKGRLPGGPRGELEADRRAGRQAVETIRRDPEAFLATLPRNIGVLWLGLDFSDVASKAGGLGVMTLVAWLSYGPVLLLGVAGLWRLYWSRRREPLFGALAILLLTTALHAVVLGGKRYRVATIDPLLLVLAGWEADCRIRSWGARVRRAGMPPEAGSD